MINVFFSTYNNDCISYIVLMVNSILYINKSIFILGSMGSVRLLGDRYASWDWWYTDIIVTKYTYRWYEIFIYLFGYFVFIRSGKKDFFFKSQTISQMYFGFQWVSDCYLTPNGKSISCIMVRTSYIKWNDDDVSALY